jgi:hypothetical protein
MYVGFAALLALAAVPACRVFLSDLTFEELLELRCF